MRAQAREYSNAKQMQKHGNRFVQNSDTDDTSSHEVIEVHKGDVCAEQIDDVNIAARRETMFLLPLAALTSTVLTHLILDETYPKDYTYFSGDLAVLIGVLVATFIWWEFAHYYRRYTTAASASRRNYNGLRERLDQLQNRVDHFGQGERATTGIPDVRQQAHAYAQEQCTEIEKALKSRGTPWSCQGVSHTQRSAL
jgi:hypothetical protein